MYMSFISRILVRDKPGGPESDSKYACFMFTRTFIALHPQSSWVKSKRFASLPLCLFAFRPFIAGSFPTLAAEPVPSGPAALQRCRPLLRPACFSSEFGKLAFIADHFVGSSKTIVIVLTRRLLLLST